MKFDRRIKFDLCYYGQVIFCKHLWGGTIYFAVETVSHGCVSTLYSLKGVLLFVIYDNVHR